MGALEILAWFLFIFVLLPIMGVMFGLILYMAYTVLKKFLNYLEELENNITVSPLVMYLILILLGSIFFYLLARLGEISHYQGY